MVLLYCFPKLFSYHSDQQWMRVPIPITCSAPHGQVFNSRQSDMCKIVCYVFIAIFLITNKKLNMFSYVYLFVLLLLWIAYLGLLHIFLGLMGLLFLIRTFWLNFMHSEYWSFVGGGGSMRHKISYQFVDCFSTIFRYSWKKVLIIWMYFSLSGFFFVVCAFYIMFKKSFCPARLHIHCHAFFLSEGFKVDFSFWSLWFIWNLTFVYDIR